MIVLYRELFAAGADKGDVKRIIDALIIKAKAALEEEEAKKLGGSKLSDKTGSSSPSLKHKSSNGGDPSTNKSNQDKPLDIYISPEVFARCDLTALAQSTLTPAAMENDPDFELTHFELIKAVKLITYQVNLILKRQDYQFREFSNKIDDKIAELIKRLDGEVSRMQGHILHVENEVEGRINFFKNEFNTLSKKLRTATPLFNEGITHPSIMKPLGTILGCLLEAMKLTLNLLP